MSAVALLARKEIRAQLVLWIAIVAAMLAGELSRHDMRESGVLFYIIGALALGAASTGHEYRHGTLSHLLAQPIRRRVTLLVKVAVLSGLLVGLAAVAAAVVFPHFTSRGPDRDEALALFVLPLLYGLVVAPWLTLKTRSTLAGTLFSGSLASLIFITGDRIAAARFQSVVERDAFRLTVMWTGSWLLVAAAAIALWRTFHTLEVPDGVRSEIALPVTWRATRGATSGRRHPFLLLVVKELRLQQMAFVVSLLYCVLFAALWMRRGSVPPFEDAISVATGVHAVIIAALAGALSSAEERSLGMLEWQLLQPISARAQFAVKVAVALSLTLGLGLGLPTALLYAAGRPDGWAVFVSSPNAGMLLLFLSGSMYLSSVAASPLIAFFACIPAFMVSFWFLVNVASRFAFSTFVTFHGLPHGVARANGTLHVIVASVLMALVLYFTFQNHRDAERSLRRAAGQVLGLLVVVSVAFEALAIAGLFL